jgi:ABC-type transport system involved in multi-copper enzyme maturation permease subunit
VFWSLLVAEERKVFKRKILWVEVAVLSALVLLINFSMYFLLPQIEGQAAQQMAWSGAVAGTLQLAAGPQIAGLLVVILIGAVVAQEYSWRTLHHVLARGVPRRTLIVGRFVALLLPVLLLVSIPFLLGAAAAAIFAPLAGPPFDPERVNFLQAAFGLLYGPYGLLPYAALGLLLAVASRSAVVAVGGGVGILLGESVLVQLLTALGAGGAQVAQWLPSMLAMSLLDIGQAIADVPAAVGGATEGLTLLAPGMAAIVVAAYTLAFLAATLVTFARQDLTA